MIDYINQEVMAVCLHCGTKFAKISPDSPEYCFKRECMAARDKAMSAKFKPKWR